MGAAEEKITEAELEVMEVLWDAGEPVTLSQIREALADRNGETVKTLLRRVGAKGAAAQEKRQVYYYRPLVSREGNTYSSQFLARRMRLYIMLD